MSCTLYIYIYIFFPPFFTTEEMGKKRPLENGHLSRLSHGRVSCPLYLISRYLVFFFSPYFSLSLFQCAITTLFYVPTAEPKKLLFFFLSIWTNLFLFLLSYRSNRFNGGKFYTYIGEVCVSVNPYRTLNIYGPDYVSQYKGEWTNKMSPSALISWSSCLYKLLWQVEKSSNDRRIYSPSVTRPTRRWREMARTLASSLAASPAAVKPRLRKSSCVTLRP